MPLPSSGQITFDNVRVETSQSAFTSYAFSGWASGYNSGCLGAGNANYAPINLLSSGSRYSTSSAYTIPIKLSDWYSYNHTVSIPIDTTASLYSHWGANINYFPCTYTSMIPVDVGTSNATLNLNISGSAITSSVGDTGCWMIFYGKPWNVNGSSNATVLGNCSNFVYSGGATLIASGSIRDPVNTTITYNYTYDVAVGNYIYYVVVRTSNGCDCDPSQC
jgi:hypothetical protein